MKRVIWATGLCLLLALVFVVPSLAGGWAVITLDELPGQIVADESIDIGFMVRQHGVSPMKGLAPTIHAELPELGKTITFAAKEQGATGHYVARLTLPEAGEWQWSIEAFTGNQPMPPLTVLAAGSQKPVEASASNSASVQWPRWVVGFIGIAGILAGLVIAFQRKARWAFVLVLAGLALSAGSIVAAADQPEMESEAEVVSVDSSLSQVEIGRRLFIAKGCMMCHSHSETNGIREFGVDMGPNLTNFTASPEYLRIWLKDPLAVKSTAQMPQLRLSEAEIEALIAFINAD